MIFIRSDPELLCSVLLNSDKLGGIDFDIDSLHQIRRWLGWGGMWDAHGELLSGRTDRRVLQNKMHKPCGLHRRCSGPCNQYAKSGVIGNKGKRVAELFLRVCATVGAETVSPSIRTPEGGDWRETGRRGRITLCDIWLVYEVIGIEFEAGEWMDGWCDVRGRMDVTVPWANERTIPYHTILCCKLK